MSRVRPAQDRTRDNNELRAVPRLIIRPTAERAARSEMRNVAAFFKHNILQLRLSLSANPSHFPHHPFPPARKWCLLTIVFIFCCPLLSPVGIALELKDIHMSSPDVNMNYIKSLLFLDVCIEIVTVKHSALSLFSFLKFGFMCVYVSIFLCFFNFFSQVSDSLSLLLYSLHVRLLRALIKINQSPPDFSVFPPATTDEVLKLVHDRPNKQSSLGALATSLLIAIAPKSLHLSLLVS